MPYCRCLNHTIPGPHTNADCPMYDPDDPRRSKGLPPYAEPPQPARRYFSSAPRVETFDTDGNRVKVFPSSAAQVDAHDGPFVWLDIVGKCTNGAAHLTVEQARVIRDALSAFIDAATA